MEIDQVKTLQSARKTLLASRRDLAAKMGGAGYSVPLLDMSVRFAALQAGINAMDEAIIDEGSLAAAKEPVVMLQVVQSAASG